MRKNGIIMAILAAAALVSSCYSVSSREDGPTASRLLSYTEMLLRTSVRAEVKQFNNMTDEVLFSCGTDKEDAAFKDVQGKVTRLADSVWQVSFQDPEMTFTTRITMCPEVCEILGIRKHVWAVDTEGKCTQDAYNSSFCTVEPMVFGWVARDYGDNIQIDEEISGTFRMESFLGTQSLDFGVLNYAEDGNRRFESSRGDLSDQYYFYY